MSSMIRDIEKKFNKGKDILSRIENLEGEVSGIHSNFENLTRGLDAVLGNRDKTFTRMDEVVRALVSLLGEEKVVAEINAARRLKSEKAAAAAFSALESTKTSGVAVVGETVTDKTIMVVEQFNAEGTPEVPAKIPVALLSLDQDLIVQALGKKVGD